MLCPEFAPFYSLRANEVDYEVSFQPVRNLLHLAVYTINEVDFEIGFQAVLNLLHLIATRQ